MQKIIFIVFIIALSSCSEIQVLTSNDEYKHPITNKNLSEFKNSSRVISKKIKGSKFNKELRKIKGYLINGHEDLVPSGIFFYAFIKDNDTIYTNPNMTYWRYKGKTILYKSSIINNDEIDNL